MKKICTFITGIILFWAVNAGANNMTVTGDMGSAIRYQLQEQVTAGDGMRTLVLSFVVPQSYESPTYRQEISGFNLTFSPQPQDRKESRDDRGNRIITATWSDPPRTVDVRLSCNASNVTKLKTLATQAPFPLNSVDPGVRVYLKHTDLVQVNEPRIRERAAQLTSGVKTQYDAVQRVISWVVDHVRYVTPPQQYDAIYSLESGKGNCQNYSHLSAALLRSAGVPVRIVNGITLDRGYDISWQKGIMTFKMGKGRHSWIEVWFPDLGWVPFDPQNTVLFVSNRFIRVEVGMDNNETKNDGLVRWSQTANARTKPTLQENIGAEFVNDAVKIKGKQEAYGPKNLLLTPSVKADFKQIEVEPTPLPPVISDAERKKLKFVKRFLFGNLEYPENIDFAFPRATRKKGRNQFEMSRSFLVETAEFVTHKGIQYAQVVVLQKPVKLEQIGLALHKFGGDGQIWLDLFRDDQGKPGELIGKSNFKSLDELSPRPGYRWENFDFTRENIVLMPGSYWIALGYTGDPVINWFYTYGKPVGPVEGTRYRREFEDREWSNALSYEFNYKVMGLTTK